MRDFFVLTRDKCRTCKGEGTITETIPGFSTSVETCRECDGSGGELKEVPLKEALTEMGVKGLVFS